MITLYDYPLSGNCYKVRLFLSLLGIEYQSVSVDFFPGREHKSPNFLELNPRGQIPVLVDDGFMLCDSGAILVYLATAYGESRWYRNGNAKYAGEVAQWLAHADTITATASAARLHDMLNYSLDVDAARAGAHAAFRVMDDHLAQCEFDGDGWLVGSEPSIADIACFPYIALAGDGGISLDHYHAIGRWIMSIKSLPGFITMPGIHPLFGDKESL